MIDTDTETVTITEIIWVCVLLWLENRASHLKGTKQLEQQQTTAW